MIENESATIDRLLRALSTDTRRQVVMELTSREPEEVTISTLVEQDSEMTNEDRIALNHSHLPQLDDAEIVIWDRETGRIRAGPAHETAVALLETLEESCCTPVPDGD